MHATLARRAGFIFRENRVPHYQKLFQQHDGKRQWHKTRNSPYLVYPFYVLQAITLTSSMWMMIRMTMGKKTWWG